MAKQFSVYFAGEIFSIKHLLGNCALCSAITRISEGRYKFIIPQNLEQRDTTATAIRNQDISAVVCADLGLFQFDGTELDSGTVAEFMIAKFCDIPAVVLRSDFRSGGDNEHAAWNLMLTGYPRTEVVTADSMRIYQEQLRTHKDSLNAGLAAVDNIASLVVAAFNKVEAQEPIMDMTSRENVYEWMSRMPGSRFENTLTKQVIKQILAAKKNSGLN